VFLSSGGGSVERYLILWHLGRAGLSHRVSVALPRSKEVFTAADKYLQVCVEILMYMTLRILSSTCSSMFSFLCELSSNQATPSVSVYTKLFLFSFHALPYMTSFLISCLYLCLGPTAFFYTC